MPVLTRFLQNARGNVMIITAITITALVAVAGLGIDLGRQQIVRLELQQAADAAALAGANFEGLSDAERRTVAERYFRLNVADGYLGVSRPAPTISATDGEVSVDATASVGTIFSRTIGISTVAAGGGSTVGNGGGSSGGKYDLLLVMDNSGSMHLTDVGSSNSLEASEAVRQERLDTCLLQANSNEDLCTDPNNADLWGTFGPTRINALRYAANFIAQQILENNRNDSRIGTISWTDLLGRTSPLTNSYEEINAFLLGMVAYGATDSTVGLREAVNQARGFRSGFIHAVVLLTDGENNDPAVDNPNSLALCSELKNSGTIVYTILLGNPGADGSDGNVVRGFLQACATTDNTGRSYFFDAPDSNTLLEAFRSILTSVRRLRITR